MTEIRVAHVIGGLRVGGAEKQFVSLMNSLRAERKLAIYVSDASPQTSLEDQLDPSVRQIRVRVRKRFFARDVMRLAAVLREERINVVHTHMFWANLYGVVAARMAGIRAVFTAEHGENRWKNGFHRMLERRVISPLCIRRFCVSPKILERRRTLDRVPADKLVLLPNGTDIPREGKSWPEKRSDFLVGSIGRFVSQKDFGNLVDAICLLRERGRPVRAVILGDGPEMPAMRDRVSAHGLDEVVRLPGMDTDVSRWYRQFDIYACSSIEEGLPVTIIEAMSYGLPVVSTDVGAIGQVVRDGVDGRIVPPANAEALAAALQGLIDTPDRLPEYGQNARQRARAEYSIDAVARTLENAYRDGLRAGSDAATVGKQSGRVG
jgi:glycosyltransferase involved in cell wall biosynthesis